MEERLERRCVWQHLTEVRHVEPVGGAGNLNDRALWCRRHAVERRHAHTTLASDRGGFDTSALTDQAQDRNDSIHDEMNMLERLPRVVQDIAPVEGDERRAGLNEFELVYRQCG